MAAVLCGTQRISDISDNSGPRSDAFSKWTEAFAIPNKEAPTIARILTEQVFCRFGAPISLLSERGREIDGVLMREVCRLLGIDKLRTTPYKPSTNSGIERFHRTLNSMIGKMIDRDQLSLIHI